MEVEATEDEAALVAVVARSTSHQSEEEAAAAVAVAGVGQRACRESPRRVRPQWPRRWRPVGCTCM